MSDYQKYSCRADLGKKTSMFMFECKDNIEAMFHAMNEILNRAKKSDTWAVGEVTLTNKTTNTVIQTMKAKTKIRPIKETEYGV